MPVLKLSRGIVLLVVGPAQVLIAPGAPADSAPGITAAGSVLGTPDYIAPEQAHDSHQADIRADLYSLGCTFYFILVGEVPFPGGSLVQKLDKQRWHMPTPVNEVRADSGVDDHVAQQ